MSAAKISCTGASFGAVTLAVVRKDLRLEWRTREVFSATVVFAALVLVTFNFSFEPGQGAVERMASGFIWVAFVFAGMLGLNRTFVTEKEEGCLDALFLSPADPGAIYLGKVIANLIFLAVTEAAVLPLFALLFNFPLARAFPTMLLPLVLGSFGFVAAGTLFAAMAAQTRIREVMLPLLLLPAGVPILIASVRLTQAALEGRDLESVLPWVGMLVLCDALFVVAGTFLFQHVLEE